MNAMPLKHIAICGAGLAGTLCAAAIKSVLPDGIKLSLIDIDGSDKADVFYGTASSPTIYDFLLSIGISEAELLPQTNSTFSVGTHYINWGEAKRSWVQSFHQPLPVFEGVGFHHYLMRIRDMAPEASDLEAYIMSVHAARKGVFAHPPEDKKTPLSSLEYGYHISPEEWRLLLSRKINMSDINRVSANVEKVDRKNEKIQSITLTNGDVIKADLFVDCTGQNSVIAPSRIQSERKLKAVTSFKPQDKLDNVCRLLNDADYGWHSETSFQNGKHRLTVYNPDSEDLALTEHGQQDTAPVEATLGYLEKPWQGNCLAMGHSAAMLEALTPAPLMLLQRDILRLTELIPHTGSMGVEAQEYNRRFTEDYCHGSIFQRSLFEDSSAKETPYWKAARAIPADEKLLNKIRQFQSRGVNAQYDLEPFGKEDWTQQHFGMGRLPRRYDPLAERADARKILQTLKQMRTANEVLASKMPPHDIYMKKLLDYLRKTHG